jgi:septal ring factor EnvC (AmiA/AmiB activator)
MKTTLAAISLCTFMAGAIISSCNSPAEKVENAEMDVVKADLKLAEANDEYLNDIATYKAQTADKIATNQKSIDDFNKRIATEKKEAKADYEKKIADLEAKNNDMKKKLDDYKAEGKENWEAFKAEFSQDMDNLGNSFANFFN